jgi:hypothetical protein
MNQCSGKVWSGKKACRRSFWRPQPSLESRRQHSYTVKIAAAVHNLVTK